MSISWKEVKPDIRTNSFQEFVSRFGLIESLRLSKISRLDTIILISRYTKQKIHRHLIQRKIEMGGLLLGNVYALDFDSEKQYATVIRFSIPSEDFKSTSVSLSLGTDVWNSARTYLDKGFMVVGWYHSHPGLGAFFSSTDRNTQRHFFKEPYHVGLVEDPFQREEKWFLGQDSVHVNYQFTF